MQKKHLIEAIIFLTYAFFAVFWVAGSLMAKPINAYFNIDGLTVATLSVNAITIAKIIGNILAVWFLTRLKPKKAFALASFLIFLGIVGIWAPDYWTYLASRLILGLGGAFVIVYFGPIVLNYFSAEERPIVNGINSVAFNTGALIATLFTAQLLTFFGDWRTVFIAIAVVSLVLLVAWLAIGSDFELGGPAKSAQAPTAQGYTLSDGVRDPVNWYLPFTYTGILLTYIAVISVFPNIKGFAVSGATLSMVLIIAGMIGTIAGIVAAKTYPLRVPMIRYAGLMLTVCATGMAFAPNATVASVMAFLAGFFMFLPMTALLTLPQELPDMTPGRVTVIFGMFWAISYAVETVLMFCATALADRTGNQFAAVIFVLVCSISAFVFSFLLPETGRRKREAKA